MGAHAHAHAARGGGHTDVANQVERAAGTEMAAPDQLTVAMLSHFFVYNPLFGPTDETEQQKLLFHYPGDLPMDHKLKNVGLSEALVNFTRCAPPQRTPRTRASFAGGLTARSRTPDVHPPGAACPKEPSRPTGPAKSSTP